MSEPLPKFDSPPVGEVVLGVQFSPLVGYTTSMAGWFWKSYLPILSEGVKWEKALDAPRIDDAIERFGEAERWGTMGFRFGSGAAPNRVQIIQSDGRRMVQIQDTRFILNWRKEGDPYPSFGSLSQDFWKIYPAFEKFVKDAGLGLVEQNQWEVTYVNRIPKGELWQSANELGKLIPKLSLPAAAVAQPAPDPLSMDWRFDFPNQRGRLYVGFMRGRTDQEMNIDEFIQITYTARGAIDTNKGWTLQSGFEMGHEAIVRTFANMTSSEAHRIWRRKI